MEKKSKNRSSQSQTKNQNIDSKKTQDASVSKPWPRSSKKRESPSNASSRSDTTRKPLPQKDKSFDKRPKPRGAYHGGALGGKSDTWLEGDGTEVGSVFLPGSKKQNLNHLLNFQYTSREPHGGVGGGAGGGRRAHGLVYTNTHKHSKELFLQSNCQFVVKSDGNYSAHLVDPDIPVNWDLVEQINVRVWEPLTCPICLGEAVAGRITRCGHSYCWPCLLHYFALSEETSRPCPICFQPIDKKHLRSVQGVWQESIPVDGELNMKLMRRAQGSTLVEPAPDLEDGPIQERDSILSVSEKKQTTLFSKLLTANHQEVMDIINRERKELSTQLAVESDNPEYCFIQEALNQLQNRESSLLSVQSNIERETPKENHKLPFNSIGDNSSDSLNVIDLMEDLGIHKPINDVAINVLDDASCLNPDAPEFQLPSSLIESSAIPSPTQSSLQKKMEEDKSKFFYFYQAADGQAVFLEGLEVRMLEASWGSLGRAPRDLRARVLRRTSGSVAEEARRRLRCLRHLPIHCPYDVLQVDLRPPYVTSDTLQAFGGELQERRRHLARKVREERQRERVISRREQALLGRGGPGLRLRLDSDQHFPSCLPPLGEDHFPSQLGAPEDDDSPTTSSSLSEHSGSLSFAKMASGTGVWKVRPSPQAQEPVVRPTARGYDSEGSDGEGPGAHAPAYNVSLSEAISAALLNATPSSSNRQAKEGKQKKKHRAKVLFSTGIQHHT